MCEVLSCDRSNETSLAVLSHSIQLSPEGEVNSEYTETRSVSVYI